MMSNKPYSVLMSVYHGDRAEWLALALESMAQQSLPPGEIVLVIDGPIDQGLQNSIRDFDTRYPGLLLVKALDRNGGLGPALNEGLAMCQYDIIVRMDADDISDLNRCEEEIRLLNDGYDMVGCNVWEFSDNPMRCDALRILPQTSNEIEAFAKKRSPFAHPAFATKKECLLAVGGYRNIRFAEDYDLFIRLLKRGYRGFNIQQALVRMRVNADAYMRRGGPSYLKDMISFNFLQLQEGWYSPWDFVVRTCANSTVALLPNSVRDFIYKKMLRR